MLSTRFNLSIVFVLATAWSAANMAVAQTPANPTEADYYKLTTLPIPQGVVLEASALEMLPGDRLAVASRRGDIYLVENPLAESPDEMKFTQFANGLHEVLGLAVKDDWLYVTQRCEVSRLKDTDKDGRADLFETVSDGWEINGDYHEYAFGSRFDADGNRIDLTVFAPLAEREAPRSPIDGRPMRRASLAEVQALLAEDRQRTPPAAPER